MKNENLVKRINQFSDDKARIRSYLTAMQQGRSVNPNEIDHLLALGEKWHNYPSFYRSLGDSLDVLRNYKAQQQAHLPHDSTEEGKIIPLFHRQQEQRLQEPLQPEQSSANPISAYRLSPPTDRLSSQSLSIGKLNPVQRKEGKAKLSSKHAQEERKAIAAQEIQFDRTLEDLLEDRLEQTLEVSRSFSINTIAQYLCLMFGESLYFDSLLSLTQQYAMADIPIVNATGRQIGKTGFNLSFFGDPGTGKTFSIKELILGNPDLGIEPHGLPGKNRYCGSITAVKFIKMAEAYQDKKFNFIVPEFHDWFRHQGMADVLKLAMEGSDVSYETDRETIGPYRFGSFLSVNYNTKVSDEGYESMVSDPHFRAIEDRMINNLHRMSEERYKALAESKGKIEKGEVDMRFAATVRDHLTLVYAIETGHPYVQDMFPKRNIAVTAAFHDQLEAAREGILEGLREDAECNQSTTCNYASTAGGSSEVVIPFSPRIEHHALQLAAAMTLPEYFASRAERCSPDTLQNADVLPLSETAIRYAISFFVHEAGIRSKGKIDPDKILQTIGKDR